MYWKFANIVKISSEHHWIISHLVINFINLTNEWVWLQWPHYINSIWSPTPLPDDFYHLVIKYTYQASKYIGLAWRPKKLLHTAVTSWSSHEYHHTHLQVVPDYCWIHPTPQWLLCIIIALDLTVKLVSCCCFTERGEKINTFPKTACLISVFSLKLE